MRIVGVIPARYESSRFPGKPLALILGKPLVIHVIEKAIVALGKENVYVATDNQRIYNVVADSGYNVVMTSSQAKTGTDRLYEFSEKVKAHLYINIQGDEPLIEPDDINRIVDERVKNPSHIVNGYTEIGSEEDENSINLPKVVFDTNNFLLYMSRALIPSSKKHDKIEKTYYKQVCIYAFTESELKAFGERKTKTPLEESEDIEILRFLEMGYRVKMVRTKKASLAVDVPEDIKSVEKVLLNDK